MRKLLKRLVEILDGTPVVTGPKQAGQSVVELALITPILITLLAGLVEIGWFANNYLTLLDVARAGARRGATLQDDVSVTTWEDNFRASVYMPVGELPADYQAASIGVMPYTNTLPGPAQDAEIAARNRFRLCPGDAAFAGELAFYNEIVCLMLQTMQPLEFDASNGVDDIVISGFAIELVDPRENGAPGSSPAWLGVSRPITGDLPQMVVVGRYPSNANECDATIAGPRLEPRDPFDFNENGLIDVYAPTARTYALGYIWNDDYSELFNGDENAGTVAWGFDAPGSPGFEERQVGFVWTGNRRIPDTNCIGSNFRIADVEQRFNLNSFIQTTDQRIFLPGQGMVLVEVFWQHKLLLNLPFFTVLEQNAEINVWAAFPMQAAQANIQFNPPG
ncbi:MAG: pilus assembly protein [Pleurocapsa minor GSE-CHR-MK-17-07R]|jgi:hypothetical protein|nr:pilus assembly protein [Pleurocapsa minor GSE-CHR-MK 17-07R]